MKVVIAGGTGFIGKALVRALLEQGHEIIVLGRSVPKIRFCFGESVTAWSFTDLELRQEVVDVVINLAGESLVGVWNKNRKEKILNSRLAVTKRLVAFCLRQEQQHSIRLLQASSTGIYGIKGERTYYEHTPLPEPADFLSHVARRWEEVAHEATKQGVPTVIMRFGIVLDPNGGMLEYMLSMFNAGCGAVLDKGEQKLSWITRRDLVRAILFLLNRVELEGVFNLVAKEPASQRQVAQLFAKHLGRRLWLRVPRFLVHLFLGEMGDTLLLGSQMIEPCRLNEAGFEFDYPNLSYYFARRENS